MILRRFWAGLSLTLIVGCSSSERPGADEGEHKKRSTGRNFHDQTDFTAPVITSPETPGFEQERAVSGFDDWEPAIAVDPTAPYVYQLVTRFSATSPSKIIFRRSHDNGYSWEPDKDLYDTSRSQADPQIVVSADGTIFAAWLDFWDTKLTKSIDHGDTWSPAVSVRTASPPPFTDHGWLAVSANGHDVYVAFNNSNSYVASSHNGGASFAAPVRTNPQDGRYYFHTGGAVAPNGSVYFASVDFSQNYTGDSHINVIRSINGGTSWTTTRVDTSPEPPDCPWAAGCYFGFLGPETGIAVDVSGRVGLVYNAGLVARGTEKTFFRSSLDGVNWSARVQVSQDNDLADNVFPQIAAGPVAGDFRIVWQGDANGNTSGWNTWYRRSGDGGATWGGFNRLSDRGDGAPYKNSAGYQFPYGDYFELDVDPNGITHVIWGEGASYDGPGGCWYTRGI